MGGMAGLEGIEQPRRHGSATAARWTPAVEDERALKALELFGNPTESEVLLPSRPESAATALRRFAHRQQQFRLVIDDFHPHNRGLGA